MMKRCMVCGNPATKVRAANFYKSKPLEPKFFCDDHAYITGEYYAALRLMKNVINPRPFAKRKRDARMDSAYCLDLIKKENRALAIQAVTRKRIGCAPDVDA